MILRAIPLVLLLAAAFACGSVQAQQYSWTDAQGRQHLTDTPPPASAKNVRRIDARGAKPEAAPASAPMPFEIARIQKDFPVTLYTSPGCKEGCERARALLNKRGVPFKEVLVWQEDTNEELKRISGGTEVPTMVVGRSVERGFEATAFDAVLDSAGYPKAGSVPARSQKAPDTPEDYVAPDGSNKVAKPAANPEVSQRPGRYDPSGLTGPAPKPGQYDPSGLTGPPPKPGQYGIPGAGK